jgi:tetratricopeptide (TPR) repeat protein
MLRAQGRYGESEKAHREALPRIEELTGPASLLTARAVSNLAAFYWGCGKLEQAERLALRAVAAYGDLPDASPADRASSSQILASIYIAEHRYQEAEEVLGPVLEGGEAVNATTAYSNLAAAALGVRDNARAEGYARRALEAAVRDLPARHPLAAAAMNNLAQACRFQGKYLEAETNYREALGIWEEALGPRHPDVARGLMNLAGLYHERGRDSGAEEMYTRAAGILERSLGERHADALVARNELAEVLRAERRYTEAEKLSRATLAAMQSTFGEDDPRLVRALENRLRLVAERQPATRRKR